MVVQSKGAHLVHYKMKGYLAGLQIYMRKRDYHVIYSVGRYKAPTLPAWCRCASSPSFHLLQVPYWLTIRAVVFHYYILVLKIINISV